MSDKIPVTWLHHIEDFRDLYTDDEFNVVSKASNKIKQSLKGNVNVTISKEETRLILRISDIYDESSQESVESVEGVEASFSSLLQLKMTADCYTPLYNHILERTPFDIEDLSDLSLHDYGSETLVFKGRMPCNKSVAVKVAFCNYVDVMKFDSEKLRRKRSLISKGWHVLKHLNSARLPTPRKLFKSHNPFFLNSFPSEIKSTEVFLATEFIEGTHLQPTIECMKAKKDKTCIALALKFAFSILDLQREIQAKLGDNYFYIDIKPSNSILCDQDIRFVDFTSIVDTDMVHVASPIYTDPADLKDFL